MLQGEELPTISQRTLGKQTDFRKAVEHHQPGLTFDRVQNLFGGFAQLQIGGIKNGLLLIGIKYALGRLQFENFSPLPIAQPCEAAVWSNSSFVSESVM